MKNYRVKLTDKQFNLYTVMVTADSQGHAVLKALSKLRRSIDDFIGYKAIFVLNF